MITEEITNFIFFDGVNKQTCQAKNEYWLGTSDPEQYLNSEIEFSTVDGQDFVISLFDENRNTIHKYLAEWQAPDRGFDKIDLLMLSQIFNFELQKNIQGGEEGVSMGYHLELIIAKVSNKIFFLIFAINGGRAPESIYFFCLKEVNPNKEFSKRYIDPYL